jgi:hypothetical protein
MPEACAGMRTDDQPMLPWLVRVGRAARTGHARIVATIDGRRKPNDADAEAGRRRAHD